MARPPERRQARGAAIETPEDERRVERERREGVRGGAPTANPRSPPTPTNKGEGGFEAYGVMVFAIRGDRIAEITGFARQPSLVPRRPSDPARRDSEPRRMTVDARRSLLHMRPTGFVKEIVLLRNGSRATTW